MLHKKNTNYQFPLDVDSIADFKSFDEHFSLPEKPEKLYKLRDDLFDAFFNVVATCKDQDIKRILLIRAKSPFDYVRLFSFVRIKAYAENIGFKIKNSQKSVFYHTSSLADSPFGRGQCIERIKTPSSMSALKARFRNLLYNVKVNGSLFYFFNSFHNGRRIANTNPGSLDMIYLRKLNKSFFLLNEAELGVLEGKWVENNSDFEKKFSGLSDTIANNMISVARSHGIYPSDEDASVLRKLTLTSLQYALLDFYNVSQSFAEKIGPCQLMAGTNCGYFNRMSAAANRVLGGENTAFAHGNEVGRIRDMRIETSLVDAFATYNAQAVSDVYSCLQKYTQPEIATPKIISVDDGRLLEFWQKQSKKAAPKKVRTIMMVGFPFDINMNMDKTFPDIYYLDMEMKLAKPLLNEGFRILYKIHPESLGIPRLNEFLATLKSFLGPGFDVVLDRFENVIDMADAFLFPFTSTTTFNFALCTNKKVVAIDFDEFVRPFSNEARALLAKSCTIIPHTFDNNNRLSFDTDLLVGTFKSCAPDPNTSFQEKYIFP